MEVTYREILKARMAGNQVALNEASLGRVYQHVKRAGKDGTLGIITAYRFANDKNVKITRKQNVAANRRLLQDIKSQGLGVFKLIGHWRECQDTSVEYEDCPEKDLVDVKEASFGVPGISRDLLLKLTKKYEQDASVYLGPDTGGKAVLLWKSGKVDKLGSFTPQKIAQGWSQVRGGHWTFEGFDYPAQSWVDALAEQASRIID